MLSIYLNGDRLYTSLISLKEIEHLNTHAVLFCPSGIHSVQHTRPVTGLCSALSRMKSEYRITVIELVSEEKIYPVLFKFLRKYIYLLPYLRHKTRIILLLRHQDQCIYVHIVILKLLIVVNQILKSLQFL